MLGSKRSVNCLRGFLKPDVHMKASTNTKRNLNANAWMQALPVVDGDDVFSPSDSNCCDLISRGNTRRSMPITLPYLRAHGPSVERYPRMNVEYNTLASMMYDPILCMSVLAFQHDTQ